MHHYLFNKLLEDDPECRSLWNASKALERTPAVVVRKASMLPNGFAIAKLHIEADRSVMHKLDWRADTSNRYWSAVLALLARQP